MPIRPHIFLSRAVQCYFTGIVLLSGTLLTTDALNPRGVQGGSWFEPFFLPLTFISLALCVIAPFLSPRPLVERFGFLTLGLLAFIIAGVACWTISFRLFGAFPF